MEKMTVAKSIRSRKIARPNAIYSILGNVWKLFMAPKYNVHYTFRADPRQEKGPFFFISNHASRLDYIFAGVPLLPQKMNFVAGYNEFHRSHLSLVFRLLRVIPKKNFTPDLYTMKEISRSAVATLPAKARLLPCAPSAALATPSALPPLNGRALEGRRHEQTLS